MNNRQTLDLAFKEISRLKFELLSANNKIDKLEKSASKSESLSSEEIKILIRDTINLTYVNKLYGRK